jgi:hypothetical protein
MVHVARIFGVAGGVLLLTSVARADLPCPPPPPAAVEVRPWPLEKVLEHARFKVTGWLEGMATASPGTESEFRTARVFDDDAEGLRLHQAYGAVERTFAEGCGFDLGGKAAVLWGTDARLLHARGLLDQQAPKEYQWDLLELWGSVRLPVRQGLRIKAGKFTTPMGFEVIEAPNNLLPSRSFLFGYAIPFTHTGVLAALDVSPRFTVQYGLFLGWDVWDDNNDALTHHVGVTWKSPSEKDTLVANVIVGPERLDDDDDLRTVLDVTWTRTWSDCWKTALNADVGVEEGAGAAGDDAGWWGAAGYVTRTFSDRLAATARGEYFRDEDGTRLGQPASLSGLTLGLDWTPRTPFPIFHVRPELRWDHSWDGVFFDAGTDEDQFSITLDVILGF